MTTLQSQLDEQRSKLDPDYRAGLDAAIDHLRRMRIGERSTQAGDRAPDFALQDKDGAWTSLRDLLDDGPVVLSFFRGDWCPFCRLEMLALLAVRDRIVAAGARLVMLTPQPSTRIPDQGSEMPGVTMLLDRMNGVALLYGLMFLMPEALRNTCLRAGFDLARVSGSGSWLLPIPADYVIGQDGMISLAYLNPDYTCRLDPDAIVAAVEALGKGALGA